MALFPSSPSANECVALWSEFRLSSLKPLWNCYEAGEMYCDHDNGNHLWGDGWCSEGGDQNRLAGSTHQEDSGGMGGYELVQQVNILPKVDPASVANYAIEVFQSPRTSKYSACLRCKYLYFAFSYK